MLPYLVHLFMHKTCKTYVQESLFGLMILEYIENIPSICVASVACGSSMQFFYVRNMQWSLQTFGCISYISYSTLLQLTYNLGTPDLEKEMHSKFPRGQIVRFVPSWRTCLCVRESRIGFVMHASQNKPNCEFMKILLGFVDGKNWMKLCHVLVISIWIYFLEFVGENLAQVANVWCKCFDRYAIDIEPLEDLMCAYYGM